MRLHAIVDDLASARAAAEGGATFVQLRRKGASTDELVEAGDGFGELEATFVVNDDVEAALRLGADGVHLGREDQGAERAVAAGLLLGTSAASVEQARDRLQRRRHPPLPAGRRPEPDRLEALRAALVATR